MEGDKPRGKATFYPGKVQAPVTTNLTDDGHKIMAHIQRTNQVDGGKGLVPVSKSDVFEHLLRLYGRDLTFTAGAVPAPELPAA